jgi:hypothetical protein
MFLASSITTMTRCHQRLLIKAQAAGPSDDELDVLAYEMEQDTEANQSDKEDTVHNSDLLSDDDLLDSVDDTNTSMTFNGSSSNQSPKMNTQGRQKHKSAKLVQDKT